MSNISSQISEKLPNLFVLQLKVSDFINFDDDCLSHNPHHNQKGTTKRRSDLSENISLATIFEGIQKRSINLQLIFRIFIIFSLFYQVTPQFPPIYQGEYYNTTGITGLTVSYDETTAYMLTTAGMLLINVTDKSNPILQKVVFSSCDIQAGVQSEDGTLLYISCSILPDMYIYILNITTPTVPVIIATPGAPGYVHELQLSKDKKTLFITEYSTGVYGLGIGNPTSPTYFPLISVPEPIQTISSSNGEYLFILCNHAVGLQIYNITDLNSPTFLSYYNSTSNLDFSGGVLLFKDTILAITVYEFHEVYFINVTNISNPVQIGSYYWSSNYPEAITNLNDRFLIVSSTNPLGGGENYLDIRSFPTVTSLGVYNTNAGADSMLKLSIGQNTLCVCDTETGRGFRLYNITALNCPSGCGIPTPYCWEGGCVQCKQNYECTSTTAPRCSSHSCVPCLQNSDCNYQIGYPYCHNGACVTCTNNSQCSSITKSKCSNYVCVPCLVNTDCSAQTNKSYCSGGTCVQCTTSSQCTSLTNPVCSAFSCGPCYANNDCSRFTATPYCNNGTCVACKTNSECTYFVPVCSATFSCTSCSIQSECAKYTSRPFCNTGSCIGCTSNTECTSPSLPKCSSSNLCSLCTQSSDCSLQTGKYCHSGTCVTCVINAECPNPSYPKCSTNFVCSSCSTNSDCSGQPGLPYCYQTCVQCVLNSECTSPSLAKCSSNACAPCTQDIDCDSQTSLPKCNTGGGGVCVECLVDSDCLHPNNPKCSSNVCVPCTSNIDCTSQNGLPYCNSGTCVQCMLNSECNYNPNLPYCYTGSSVCVNCLDSINCTNTAASFCNTDPTIMSCQPCVSSASCLKFNGIEKGLCNPNGDCTNCTANSNCPALSPICTPTFDCGQCLTSADCFIGNPYCSPNYMCVQCLVNSECGGNVTYCWNFECVGCVTDADCLGSAGICSPAHTCVQCLRNSECDAPTPFCSNQICIECFINSDCPTTTPVCTVNNQCVECIISSDCPHANPVCIGNQCFECITNTECSGALPVCNNEMRCTQCLTNYECINVLNLPYCSPFNNCTECLNDYDCGGGYPACSPSYSCVECTNNTYCSGSTSVCFNETCVQCAIDSDCPSNTPVCFNFTCYECINSENCTIDKHICNGTNYCVDCLTNEECLNSELSICVEQMCVQCISNLECTGATPVCDNSTYTCIPLLSAGISSVSAISEVAFQAGTMATRALTQGSSGAVSRPMTMRMFTYLKYLKVAYPSILVQAYAQSGNSELGFVPLPQALFDASNSYKSPENFGKFGLNGLFIVNYWPNLTTMMVAILAGYALNDLIKRKDKIKNSKLKWIIEIAGEVLVWNYIISYFLASSGLAIFYTFIEFQSLNDEGSHWMMILSLFVDLANILGSAYFLSKLMDKSRNLLNDPLLKSEPNNPELKKYKVLYLDYNLFKLSQFYYAYVLLARSTAFVFVITMIPGSPTVQLLLMGMINVVMILYLLITRPFKLLIKNIENAAYEMVLLIINGLILIITRINDPQDVNVILLGTIVFWMQFTIKILTICFTIMELGYSIKMAIQKLKAKKKLEQVSPGTSNDGDQSRKLSLKDQDLNSEGKKLTLDEER